MLPARTLKVDSHVAVTLATPEMVSRVNSAQNVSAQPVGSLTLCQVVTINAPRLLSVSLSPKKLRQKRPTQLVHKSVQLTAQWYIYPHQRAMLKTSGTMTMCMLIFFRQVPMIGIGLGLMMHRLKAEVTKLET